MPHSIVAAAFLLAHLPALAADSAVITHIVQRPWIINAGGVLKSETELTIENHRGQAVDAWVVIRVPGKPDCMESLGSLPQGASKRVVHVPELTTDGDPVTFAIHDNAAGDTASSVPVLAGEALHATKVTLSWQPSTDNHAFARYQVFRDGARIADLSAVFNSWMDDAVKPGTTCRYSVKARDLADNLSPDGVPAAVTTLP